jgi:hypothetical protein
VAKEAVEWEPRPNLWPPPLSLVAVLPLERSPQRRQIDDDKLYSKKRYCASWLSGCLFCDVEKFRASDVKRLFFGLFSNKGPLVALKPEGTNYVAYNEPNERLQDTPEYSETGNTGVTHRTRHVLGPKTDVAVSATRRDRKVQSLGTKLPQRPGRYHSAPRVRVTEPQIPQHTIYSHR